MSNIQNLTVKNIFILNGGYGKRLESLTKDKPKCLVEINKKPFIDYQLNMLNSYNFENVHLLTGHLSNKIYEYIKKVEYKYDFKIHLIKDPKPKFGTGSAVLRQAISLKKDFYLMYGDSYINFNLKLIDRKFATSKLSLMSVYKNNNKIDNSNVRLFQNLICDYHKNKNFYYIDYGVCLIKYKDILEFKINNKNLRDFDMKKIFNYLIIKKKLSYYLTNFRFFHIGNIKSLNEFNEFINNNTNN